MMKNEEHMFMLCKLGEEYAHFANKTAVTYYGESNGRVEVAKLLQTCENNPFKLATIRTQLQDEEELLFLDLTMITNIGEKKLAHVRIGFANEEETELFIDVVHKEDDRLLVAKSTVDTSNRAEAILEDTDNLKVYYCNQLFYDVFGASYASCLEFFDHEVANTFCQERKSQIIDEIKLGLERGKTYYTEVEITTLSGEKVWYSLDLQRRNLGEVGEKLMCTMVDISDLKNTANQLTSFTQYFDAMNSLSGESLFVIDVKTRILRQKGAAAQELNMPEELLGYPESAYSFIHEEDLEDFKQFANHALNGIGSEERFRLLMPDGGYQWYEFTSMIIRDEAGAFTEIFGKIKNVHEEQNMEEGFSRLNQYFNAMQELSDDVLYRVDVDTMTLYHVVEPGNETLFGKAIPDYINTLIRKKVVHPDDADHYRQSVQEWYAGKSEGCEVRVAINSKEYEWYSVKGKKIFDEAGNVKEVFGKMINIQKQKEYEVKARYDLMTKVLNKVSFEEKVEEILKNAKEGEKHALVFIDLDDFKDVNDTLGHGFGDFLLTTVGKRLKQVLRESDIVGRVGGDEFVVFIHGVDGEESVVTRAELLLDTLQHKFSYNGNERNVKASLGVALYPAHGRTYQELVEKSDLALYESKVQGKNVVTLYSQE